MNGHQADPISIKWRDLTIKDVLNVARRNAKVKISEETIDKLSQTSEWLKNYVEQILKELEERKKAGEKLTDAESKQRMIYGVTTGFGELKSKYITDPDKAKQLQRNIVLSHASGVGTEFDQETTRAIMLLRAHILASGHCGVRPEVVQQLETFLNLDIYPSIPEQGSVGASGDLAPLAHLALGLIGEGPVNYGGEQFDKLSTLKVEHPELEVQSLELSYKEGLALVNGLTVMTGIGILAHADAKNLVEWADVIGAVTLESILGSSRAFDRIVFTVYGHEGAGISAAKIRQMIEGSELINLNPNVHDAYSVRCIPQVHGAARDVFKNVQITLENQLKTVDDDPIMFSETEIESEKPLYGLLERRHFEQGNFHGEPVAFAMDMLAIAVAELGNISERRTQMLLDKHHNQGLPACLVNNPDGVNSGYMIAQYTAAALVSENKILSHPASVDSIPTSANSEDHVSMGTIAARKARKVIENVKNILAIELLCATEALSYRLGHQQWTDSPTELITGECGKSTRRLYEKVRIGANGIPHLNSGDMILYQLIKRANEEFLSQSSSDVISNQADL
ncbi:MAG TPA: histidine ammonia-lyase [Pyrinomonadaceae bacterium]|jgi:histidine ammonia-lyase